MQLNDAVELYQGAVVLFKFQIAGSNLAQGSGQFVFSAALRLKGGYTTAIVDGTFGRRQLFVNIGDGVIQYFEGRTVRDLFMQVDCPQKVADGA